MNPISTDLLSLMQTIHDVNELGKNLISAMHEIINKQSSKIFISFYFHIFYSPVAALRCSFTYMPRCRVPTESWINKHSYEYFHFSNFILPGSRTLVCAITGRFRQEHLSFQSSKWMGKNIHFVLQPRKNGRNEMKWAFTVSAKGNFTKIKENNKNEMNLFRRNFVEHCISIPICSSLSQIAGFQWILKWTRRL